MGDVFSAGTDSIPEKSLKLYSHILNAHQIWNNRIESRQAPFGVWEMHTTPDLRNIDKANYEHTWSIIDKFDLDNTINYTRKRATFSKKICDLLFHVINHATYHRGQIATDFKQNGLEPLATDYILFERK